jgi:hypothetical protein
VNPLLALSDSDRDVTALVYAGLMGEDGTGAMKPVLASGYTVSPDGKTYTFTIRADAKFSDGTAVTADDVVFTIEKAQDPALKSPEFANWSGVAVTAVDAQDSRSSRSRNRTRHSSRTPRLAFFPRISGAIRRRRLPVLDAEHEPVGAGTFPCRVRLAERKRHHPRIRRDGEFPKVRTRPAISLGHSLRHSR